MSGSDRGDRFDGRFKVGSLDLTSTLSFSSPLMVVGIVGAVLVVLVWRGSLLDLM